MHLLLYIAQFLFHFIKKIMMCLLHQEAHSSFDFQKSKITKYAEMLDLGKYYADISVISVAKAIHKILF